MPIEWRFSLEQSSIVTIKDNSDEYFACRSLSRGLNVKCRSILSVSVVQFDVCVKSGQQNPTP